MGEEPFGEIRISRELTLWGALTRRVMLVLLLYLLAGPGVAAAGPAAPLTFLLAGLLLLAIAIPLMVITGGIRRTTAEWQTIQEELAVEMAGRDGELVEFDYQAGQEGFMVVATVRAAEPLDQAAVDAVALALSRRPGRPVTLEVTTLPVTRSGGPR